MSNQPPLNKRQINLLILIGCAILIPLLGNSIRVYIDNYMIHELIATLLITFSLFIVITKSSRLVYSKQYKHINTDDSIV